MSTLSTALQHSCPAWQGASVQALAVQGCPSPGSRFRWSWGYVLSRRQHALWSVRNCASDNPGEGSFLWRSEPAESSPGHCIVLHPSVHVERKCFVPSPCLGQVKAFTFIVSSFTFSSRERAVPSPSHDWLIESQRSFAMT